MEHTNCPESKVWHDFLAGRLPPAERTKLELHLVTCLRCRVGLISEFDSRQESTTPASLAARPSSSYRWLALAASVVMAVGVTFLVWNYAFKRQVVPTVEPTRSSRTNSTFTLTTPADGAELSRTQVEFAWEELAGKARYLFTLTNEKGDIVARESGANNKIVLDLAKLQLATSHTYYWTVTALMPDGTSVESGVAAFKIK